MTTTPPPIPPPVPSNTWSRVSLSMVGLLIALSPAPVLLYYGRDLPELWHKAAIDIVMVIIVVTTAGSYLCLRPLIRKRWVALLWCPFLALGFMMIDAAIGFFFGCLYALRNV
jgi:hypothetical protein